MRAWALCGLGLACIGAARLARESAKDEAPQELIATPYAPSQHAAPFVSLGYREAAADLLWVRLTGYFGGDQNTGEGVAGLVEAIVALDPSFQRVYEWGARAMTIAHHDVDRQTYLRAVAVLDQGAQQFPSDWRYPGLAALIYTQDLPEVDPAQKRTYEEKGTLLAERAAHLGAPDSYRDLVIHLHTALGRENLAIKEIEEAMALTDDPKVRDRLVEKAKALKVANAEAISIERTEQLHRFTARWKATRPDVPPTMFVILGAAPSPTFDLRDTAGEDLLGSEPRPSDDD